MNQAIFEPKRDGLVLTLYIRGYLNESTEFPEVVQDDVQLILLDCERLEGINSVAVGNWIAWISDICAHTPIRLQFCQRSLINVISTVSDMLPANSIIESLYVPYFCESCDGETFLFFNTSNLILDPESKTPIDVPKETKCKFCKKSASIDVIERLYFSFLEFEKS